MGDDESTWDTSTLIDGQTMTTLSDVPSSNGLGASKDCAMTGTSPTTAIMHAAQHMASAARPRHHHPLDHLMTKPNPADRIAYMAGQDDFRAARVRCNDACIEYNSTPEHASTAERAAKWLKYVYCLVIGGTGTDA
jgi:ribosomal protein L16/L10AE